MDSYLATLYNNDFANGIIRQMHQIHSSFRMEDVRPVSDFLGTHTDEVKPFSIPGSFGQTLFRCQKNISHYKVNYCILVLSVAIFSILTSPFALICLIILIGGWYSSSKLLLLYSLNTHLLNQEIRVYGIKTTPKVILFLSGGLSLILFTIVLQKILTWTVSISAVLIACHAGLRDPISTRDEVGSDEGDVEGGGTAS